MLHNFGSGSDGFFPGFGQLVFENGSFLWRHVVRRRSRGPGRRDIISLISPKGNESVFYPFLGAPDGADPSYGGLLFTKARFMARRLRAAPVPLAVAGAAPRPAIESLGDERVLHSFRGGSDGRSPQAGLIALNLALT